MVESKKFISPGAWFSMLYPISWSEFEGGEDSFLFYNPDKWTGNFRISAYRGQNNNYGAESIKQELKDNSSAITVKVEILSCAYSKESFMEGELEYTSHIWITGIDDVAFECSFTAPEGSSLIEAENTIASLQVRKPEVKYPAEIIPVRLLEIYQINEAFEWMSSTVKDSLKKDFQGGEGDIENMQKIIDNGTFSPKKKDAWMSIGIVLCVILANEVEGMEWRTLIDGNREVPVLFNRTTGDWIDPMKLTWSKIKVGEKVHLAETYAALV